MQLPGGFTVLHKPFIEPGRELCLFIRGHVIDHPGTRLQGLLGGGIRFGRLQGDEVDMRVNAHLIQQIYGVDVVGARIKFPAGRCKNIRVKWSGTDTVADKNSLGGVVIKFGERRRQVSDR